MWKPRVNSHRTATIPVPKGARAERSHQNSIEGEKSCRVGYLENTNNLLVKGHRQFEETLEGRSQGYKYPDLTLLLFDLLTGHPTG